MPSWWRECPRDVEKPSKVTEMMMSIMLSLWLMRLTVTLKVVNVVDSMRILINGKASLWRQTKVRYLDLSSCINVNDKDKSQTFVIFLD